MKNKTLLLIGGTGFFGKSILDYFSRNIYLNKKINKIIVLSRSNFNSKIIVEVKKNYKFKKINADILRIKKLPKANYVIYCALLKDYKDDYLALKNYVNLAKSYHRNSQILYISSGAIYGKQPTNLKKIKESYIFLNKKNNYLRKEKKNQYSLLKLKSEKVFKKLKDYGIRISIARCFAFVGRFLPRNSKYAVGNFIENILKNKNILVKSNYNVIRTYMYADDLVRWLIKILENSKINCPTYNVGSENAVNLQKFCKILATKYNLNCILGKTNKNRYDIYVPNTYKIKKELNLVTKFNSLKAVTKTINLLKKNEKN